MHRCMRTGLRTHEAEAIRQGISSMLDVFYDVSLTGNWQGTTIEN